MLSSEKPLPAGAELTAGRILILITYSTAIWLGVAKYARTGGSLHGSSMPEPFEGLAS